MIHYLSEKQIFALENRRVTYAFAIANGRPYHLYFGEKIDPRDLEDVFALKCLPRDKTPGFSYNQNSGPSEMPTYGKDDFREPMITYEAENGDILCEALYTSHRIIPQEKIPGMPSTRGGETLEVTFVDGVSHVEITLCYTVFEDVDAITRTCRIRNVGESTVKLLRAYSFSFDLPTMDVEVLSLHGNWATERSPERVPLHHGVWSIDSKRVSSSSQLNPFMAVMEKGATEESGRVWGVNLVYSSSFRLFAEGTYAHQTRVGGGISDFCFDWRLGGGETFCTPEAVLVYSGQGLGEMSRIFHDTYREHLINPRYVKAVRPLVINNWEATYFNFDREKLFEIIDASAGTGIDTFVLDDGWFGVRNDDHSGLGDWFVNTDKLVGGLKPIIDRCHEKGLKFGLWFEPEMVNPDSDLYRAHPDWAVHCPGHTLHQARWQYCLDLTREDVRDYIVDVVSKILDNHEIDYVKWDYNRNVTEMWSAGLPAEKQREFAHRYVLGVYDLCERLVMKYPHIFFEGCASGGARFDPAILYYFPQIWTSDNSDALMRTRIQYGTSLCYPLSAMSCHVSVCPNHQTGRTTPMSSRANMAHLGATGYELNVSRMPKEELEKIPSQVAEYQRMERLVMEGDLYRLRSPFEDRYFCFQLVSKDKSECHVTFMRTMFVNGHDTVYLRLRGLDPDAVYELEENGARFHGSTLMNVGLNPQLSRADYSSATFYLKKV